MRGRESGKRTKRVSPLWRAADAATFTIARRKHSLFLDSLSLSFSFSLSLARLAIMPRTDAANHVRTAPFIVGPWRHTTRKNKNMESGDDGSDGGDAGADASAGQRTTTLTSAPLPPLAKKPAPGEEPDYDSAWDDEEADRDVEGAEDEEEIAAAEEEEEDEGGAKQGFEETKTLSGRGYLAFFPPSGSSSSPFLRAVSGHLVDAASMTAVGVSGIEIDPADSGDLGAEVPPADACSFAAGDRLLALALFLKKGGKKRGRGGGGAPCSSPLPSAVVLALASMMEKTIIMPAHRMDDGEHEMRTGHTLFNDYAAVAESLEVYTPFDCAWPRGRAAARSL